MSLGEPRRTQWDLHFWLFGIPVRIHPLFWLVAVVLGVGRDTQLIYLLAWVVAVFVGILVHELGHALVVRMYGFLPSITLHGLGGLTSYSPAYASRRPGTLGEIVISAAGPGAGFLLAAAIAAVLVAAGPGVLVGSVAGFLPYVMPAGPVGAPLLNVFIADVLFVCIFWGLINLVPVYPLDGSHIARELLVRVDPHEGARQSLVLSIVAAVAMVVIAMVTLRDLFIAVMFAILAYYSYAALQAPRRRGPW